MLHSVFGGKTPVQTIVSYTGKKLTALLTACLFLVALTIVESAAQESSPFPQLQAHHGQVISLPEFAMSHQGGVVMKLEIEFETGYTNFSDMADFLEEDRKEEIMDTAVDFLESYPNNTDFFEIVNRGLNQHLRDSFPELESLQTRFTIDPRPGVQFTVLSGAWFRNNQLDEFYGFVLDDQPTDHQGAGEIDVRVWFQYLPDLEASEIPNVLNVRQNVTGFINDYPNTTDFFEIYTKNMASSVLEGFDKLKNVHIEIAIPPMEDTPYPRFSEVFYDREDFEESFGFEVSLDNSENGLISYYADLDYAIGIADEEYPNIIDVENEVFDFVTGLSTDEAPAAQLYDFLDEYFGDFNGVLRKLNVGFVIESDGSFETLYYSGYADEEHVLAGYGISMLYEHAPGDETIVMEAGFVDRERNSISFKDDPEIREDIFDLLSGIMYEGDLIQMNNELAYLFYNLEDGSILFDGELDSEVYWQSGNGLNSTAYQEGTVVIANTTGPEPEFPHSIQLDQNYPNPFNPTTLIGFSIPESGHVQLHVYNVAGQRIKTLINESLPGGTHQINFDGTSLSSGVYLYRLQTDNEVVSRKMILVK